MNLTSRIKITKAIKEISKFDSDTSIQIDAMMAEQMNLFHTVFNKAWFAFMAGEDFSNKEIHQFDNSTYLAKHGYSFNTKYAYSIAKDAVDKAKMAHEAYKYRLDDIDKRIEKLIKENEKNERKLKKLTTSKNNSNKINQKREERREKQRKSLLSNLYWNNRKIEKENKKRKQIASYTFGSKRLQRMLSKKNISTEHWQNIRNNRILSCAKASASYGNDNIKLIDEKTLLIKLTKKKHIKLNVDLTKLHLSNQIFSMEQPKLFCQIIRRHEKHGRGRKRNQAAKSNTEQNAQQQQKQCKRKIYRTKPDYYLYVSVDYKSCNKQDNKQNSVNAIVQNLSTSGIDFNSGFITIACNKDKSGIENEKLISKKNGLFKKTDWIEYCEKLKNIKEKLQSNQELYHSHSPSSSPNININNSLDSNELLPELIPLPQNYIRDLLNDKATETARFDFFVHNETKMNSQQLSDSMRKTIKSALNYVKEIGCSQVNIERLNFDDKKRDISCLNQYNLTKDYNHMLHSLPYSLFKKIMEIECYKSDIILKQVNPAYSSRNTYVVSVSKKNDTTKLRHFGAALIISLL